MNEINKDTNNTNTNVSDVSNEINETKMDITNEEFVLQENDTSGVRKSTVFYEQWYKTIKNLPPREREKAYKYIFDYAFYGIEPEDKTGDKTKRDKTTMSYVVYSMAKPNIDSAKKRYDMATESGQKGGRPKKVTGEILEKIVELRKNGLTQKEVANELSLSLKTIQRVERDISQNHNDNVNDNVNVNENDNSVASVEDNTSGLAVARTVASLQTTETAEEVDFQSTLNCFSNKRLKSIIDDKISECITKNYPKETIIESISKEFSGTFYQCNKDTVIEYVSRRLV